MYFILWVVHWWNLINAETALSETWAGRERQETAALEAADDLDEITRKFSARKASGLSRWKC